MRRMWLKSERLCDLLANVIKSTMTATMMPTVIMTVWPPIADMIPVVPTVKVLCKTLTFGFHSKLRYASSFPFFADETTILKTTHLTHKKWELEPGTVWFQGLHSINSYHCSKTTAPCSSSPDKVIRNFLYGWPLNNIGLNSVGPLTQIFFN